MLPLVKIGETYFMDNFVKILLPSDTENFLNIAVAGCR